MQHNPGYGHNSRATKPPVEERDTRSGTFLLILRQYFGISQKTVAGQLGVSFQQVQKYENGKNRMSAPKIEMAADLFSMPIAAFFRKHDLDDPKIEEKIEMMKQEAVLFRMFHDLNANEQVDFLDMSKKTYDLLKERGNICHD
ncbi:MAG: helix-turn-helix domain-containing protein [Alphaproteobacteria bacterium]